MPAARPNRVMTEGHDMTNPYEFVDEAYEMGQIDGSYLQAYVLREIQLNVIEAVTGERE